MVMIIANIMSCGIAFPLNLASPNDLVCIYISLFFTQLVWTSTVKNKKRSVDLNSGKIVCGTLDDLICDLYVTE